MTRFLWVKDYNRPATNYNLLYLRFTRVPFGINASPFLLNIVLQDFLSKPPANLAIKKGRHKFYVNNLIMSVCTLVEAVEIYASLTGRMNSVQM